MVCVLLCFRGVFKSDGCRAHCSSETAIINVNNNEIVRPIDNADLCSVVSSLSEDAFECSLTFSKLRGTFKCRFSFLYM